MYIRAQASGLEQIGKNVYIWINEREFHTFIGMLGKQLQDIQVLYKHQWYHISSETHDPWVIVKLTPDNSFNVNKLHIEITTNNIVFFVLDKNWKDIYESENE